MATPTTDKPAAQVQQLDPVEELVIALVAQNEGGMWCDDVVASIRSVIDLQPRAIMRACCALWERGYIRPGAEGLELTKLGRDAFFFIPF